MITDRTDCRKRCFAIVALSLWTGCTGAITFPPQNAVSDVKGSVIFNCTTGSLAISSWTFSRNGSESIGQYESITDDKCVVQSNYTNNYSSEPKGSDAGTKICNLIIFDIHKDLAGVYTCIDTNLAKAATLLTVVDLGSHTIQVQPTAACVTPNSTNVSCSIDYSGSVSPAALLPPSLNLTSDLGNVVINTTEIVSPNRVTRYVTFEVSSSGSVGPLHCVAFFKGPQNPPPNLPYASNAPLNKYNANMSITHFPISVAPSIARISGQNCSTGGTSTILECLADGCPEPNTTWSVIDVNSHSCTLDVKGNKLNATFSGSFRCTATNSEGFATADVTVTGCVGPRMCDGSTVPVIPIAVVVSYCGACILISIIFLIVYGSSKKHRAQLNDTCPRLKDMLSCMNGKGCSPWIILTVFIAVLASIFLVPALLIATYCCGKDKKHQGKKKKKTEESGMESPTNNSHNNSPPTNRQQGDPYQIELQSQDSYHPSRQQTPLGKVTPVNPDGIQYSELPLPIDQRAGSRKPIQFIDGQEGAYADLWST